VLFRLLQYNYRKFTSDEKFPGADDLVGVRDTGTARRSGTRR